MTKLERIRNLESIIESSHATIDELKEACPHENVCITEMVGDLHGGRYVSQCRDCMDCGNDRGIDAWQCRHDVPLTAPVPGRDARIAAAIAARNAGLAADQEAAA
jgi:hypothetical protein